MENINLSKKIENIIKLLSNGLYERENIVALTLLSAIAGKPIFLYGPPGTAKSFIAKRISYAFKDSKYFGYLMQRFSTPEDIFGPISLEELKNDRYVRKIEGYLPDADFAFLDEIWKSSPAILNTLLTIINERIFKNGVNEIKVPLKALISASNETPPEGQGLEALYDRFIMRLNIKNIQTKDNFEKILQNTELDSFVDIDDNLKISTYEWIEIRKSANNIKLSKTVIDIIHYIKLSIDKFNEENNSIYVSDRRWQHIAYLLKLSAYLSGKEEADIYDCFIIYNCLWSVEEHIEAVKKITENAIRQYYNFNDLIDEWKNNFENIKTDIDNECFYLEKVYDTENIDDKYYIAKSFDVVMDEYNNKAETIIYIPIKQLQKNGYFYPLDISRNQTKKFRCNFFGSDKCIVEINSAIKTNGLLSNRLSKNYEALFEFEAEYNIKRLNAKKIEKEKKEKYINVLNDLLLNIDNIIYNIKNNFEISRNIFMSDEEYNFFREIFYDYIDNLESEKLNAEKLKSEIENNETFL